MTEEKVDEDMKKLEEETKKLEEESKKLEEGIRRLEEGSRKLEEGSRKLDEGPEKLDEEPELLEEETKQLDEGPNMIEEIFNQEKPTKKVTYPRSDNHINPNIRGAPVDYSFRKVFHLAELENGTPREYRVGIPKKGSSGKYVSSSLWANYNHLADLKKIHALVNVSFHSPETVAWLDVSFNEIEILSGDLLLLTNLKILYLHGNKIKFFIEVSKLKPLKFLKTLTLHGNPIEENPNYRSIVVKTLPQLVNFDFSLVTK